MRGIVIEFQLKDTPRTTETDENGFYEIELPRGVYDVRVIVKGYRTYIDEVVVLPNENLVQDIELETLESGSEEDENQFARGFSFFILVVIINLMIALYFVTFHKKKVIKSADEIIGEEDSKRKQEKETRDDVYRKKIYTPETLELKEEEEKPLKEVEKQKKEMAILDKIIEKGRYVDKGGDFVHTGYGAVFKEYMESDEIEFIDEDVEWGGGEGTPDESEDEGIDEDLFDEYGQRIRRDKDEAFDWAD